MQIKSKGIQSEFITANAGSGKTYTVIQRIKNIIELGECPSSILCITFTNSAKEEMQSRFHNECKHLIGEKEPKIITFHALCLETVSMFTHETNMPFEFEIMDNMGTAFVESVTNQILLCSSAMQYIKHTKILFPKFQELCKEIMEKYQILTNLPTRISALEDYFQMKYENSFAQLIATQLEILQDVPLSMLQSLKSTSKDLPSIVDNALAMHQKYSTPQENDDDIHEDFAKYTKCIAKLRITKEPFAAYKEKIQNSVNEVFNIQNFQESYLLNNLAEDIIRITELQKKEVKKYTFNDLIYKALAIFNNPELKHFALFKFGSKFKHIIIDEAQDTNNEQWQIINCLTEEIRSTQMSDGSLCIVGDPKQTIYGFQGSEEKIMESIFLQYQRFLEQKYLAKSYRTTQPILDVINNIEEFNITENAKHISAFQSEVGSVNIIASDISEKEDEIDHIANTTVQVVQSLLTQKLQHEKYYGKKIEPQDIAILVRNRPNQEIKELFQDIFFQNRIPISFNEKIDIKKSYAVLDFMAMLKLCISPFDAFSLYGILKSPIFNISEQEFAPLFNKNTDVTTVYHKYSFVYNVIERYQKILNRLGIVVFFSTLYNEYYAKYSKNEQNTLLIFIQKHTNTHQFQFIQFIQNFERNDAILYNKNNNSNAITFTTAHSAKGLEYPIVIYLDTNQKENSDKKNTIFINGAILIKKTKEHQGSIVKSILEKQKANESGELLRLYYVAISRASEHFYYICNKKQSEKESSFYGILHKSLQKLNATITSDNNFTSTVYSKNTINDDSIIAKYNTEHTNEYFVTYKHFSTENIHATTETNETRYGIFIHKLFENIEKLYLLKKEIYTEYLTENINFEEILKKVQYFDKKITSELRPLKILREHEFVFKGKIIRLDAIYIQNESIAIVDYKTHQKTFLSKEIKNQLIEYKQAVEKVFQKNTKCYIAWFHEEILEEI